MRVGFRSSGLVNDRTDPFQASILDELRANVTLGERIEVLGVTYYGICYNFSLGLIQSNYRPNRPTLNPKRKFFMPSKHHALLGGCEALISWEAESEDGG